LMEYGSLSNFTDFKGILFMIVTHNCHYLLLLRTF
jgi:hypothetical protein